MIDKSIAKCYLTEVKRALKNAKAYQKSVIVKLDADIQEYISENPDATEAEFLTHFGNPDDYATEYVATMSPSEQKAKLSVKKRIVMAVIAGILAALLIWGIGIVTFLIESDAVDSGYYVFSSSVNSDTQSEG